MACADYISANKNGNMVVDIPQLLFDLYCFAFLSDRQLHLAKYGKRRVRKKWWRVFDRKLTKYLRKQWKKSHKPIDSAKAL